MSARQMFFQQRSSWKQSEMPAMKIALCIFWSKANWPKGIWPTECLFYRFMHLQFGQNGSWFVVKLRLIICWWNVCQTNVFQQRSSWKWPKMLAMKIQLCIFWSKANWPKDIWQMECLLDRSVAPLFGQHNCWSAGNSLSIM